jgi:lysozyme
MNIKRLTETIKKHEGFRAKAYTDTVGKLTIGYGRNLDDVGISQDEASFLLAKDIGRAIREAYGIFGETIFENLSDIRQEVIVNMIFNMGVGKFSEFKNFIAAVREGESQRAHDEMLDSVWAKQVKSRAHELAEMFLKG